MMSFNLTKYCLSKFFHYQRLDGRQPYDYRKVKMSFGLDRGCCQVEIGDTRYDAEKHTHDDEDNKKVLAMISRSSILCGYIYVVHFLISS